MPDGCRSDEGGATLPPTSGTARRAREAARAWCNAPRASLTDALEDVVLRKLGTALLALPVVALVYLTSLTRRGVGLRIAAALAASMVMGLLVVTSLPPAPSTAVPQSEPPKPVAAELLATVRTGHALSAPMAVAFDAPMDPASVAAALRVTPETPLTFGWDADGRVLTIEPLANWSPSTLYTIIVSAAARSADGGALASPVRALVLTARAGSGEIAATKTSSGRARLDTAFRIRLDRAVDLAALRAALRTEPALDADIAPGATDGEYVLRILGDLAPDTAYRVWLEGLADTDGVPFATSPSIDVRTVTSPSVVRFRPRSGTTGVERGASISVRFTEPMDRRATAAAFRVTVDGKAASGRLTWAEQDTVLVFVPISVLAYGATVVASVDATAVSKAGVPISKVASGTFKTVPAPPPPAAPRKTVTAPIPTSGGSGAVSGSWSAVEAYYLKLMNCTRTGGVVTSSGACSSPGGRAVAPLMLSGPISSKVSRPYAKLLATRGLCSHFIGGDPGDRLRRAGFTNYRWAENLGCRSGNPHSAVLGSHLYFQSEKSYNGGHYVNLMNAAYDRAGIGVWVYAGRVRLVVSFYHP